MRTFLFVTSAILLGVALGAGTAVFRIRSAPWNRSMDESIEAKDAPASPKGPKVVANRLEHNFGVLERDVPSSYQLLLSNQGDAPLTLSDATSSCKCVRITFEREELPPGASTKATVTWTPKDKPGPAEQTATIRTNDPACERLALTLSGRVMAAMRVTSDLTFSHLSTGETATASTRLYCYLDEPLKILSHQWSDETTARYFDAAVQPLSAEELKPEANARSGVAIRVAVKPGLPPGAIRQTLVLKTNLASTPTVSVPVEGSITSDITLVGRGLDADTNTLNIGQVNRQAGLQRTLLLVVRGPSRHDVQFKLGRVEPSLVKVSLGQRRDINNGAVVQVPLTIDIPAGSPRAIHLGSQQGELGEIVLETTHPQLPKLRIRLRFAIED